MTTIQTTDTSRTGARIGFETLEQELDFAPVEVSGAVPEWLSGTLLRVTPAMLDVGGRSLRHWFDGLAMLNAFSLRDGGIEYGNRYLDSDLYRRARQGRSDFAGFAQDPCRSLFQRVATAMVGGAIDNDNGNVNLTRLGERWVALTEIPIAVEFDAATLATKGRVRWDQRVAGQLTTAHPHHDPARGEALNYVAHLGPRSSYRIFTVADGTTTQRELARIPVSRPAYMHSFAVTENYVVLTEFPLVVNPLALAFSGRAFIDNYRWEPERGTIVTAVDRRTGQVDRRWQTSACFGFHHVNAFERAGELIVDFCAYPDAEVIWALEVERLRSGARIGAGELRRLRLPLAGGEPQEEVLAQTAVELPRINYRSANGKPYRYVYGAGNRVPGEGWLDQLVKVDTGSGAAAIWAQDGCYPGEPVFVAAPGGQAEDAGVVLSVVLDAGAGRSFLLVLDAETFEERARGHAPHAIPFGFHGQFAAA